LKQQQTVFIVDDDEEMLDLLCHLIDDMGETYKAYSSSTEFLEDFDPNESGCLILDIRMKLMSGLELQKQLVARNSLMPIIFCSAYGDISLAVKTMQLGAATFISKPFIIDELIYSVKQALIVDSNNRKSLQVKQSIELTLSKLSVRENQVFLLITKGEMNKMVAAELGISERTVEVHRSNVMKKLGVSNLAELVRLKVESE
jgi:two-component system response regulator FixJ